MSGLSEGELHVQAMRLVCEALQDREQDGLEVDWDVLRQMHDQMDAMLQALQHKHRYDSSEMVDLRKDRDAAKAEIETLRTQLANAKRAASDEFTERQVLTVEQQQDAAIWQQQLDAARAEIETLRKQLAEQQAETVDVRRQRNNETDRLNATNAVSVQQRDEIAYLRARLDEERSVSAGLRKQLDAAQSEIEAQRKAMADDSSRLRKAEERVWPGIGSACDPAKAMADEILGLRQQLDAANAAWNLQCAGIERLQAFVNLSRRLLGVNMNYADVDRLRSALAELDAGTEPTPVAEPIDGEGGA